VYSTPSATMSGVHPRLFFASKLRALVDQELRNRDRSGAPCSAVSPFLFAAFAESPSASYTNFTAANASSSVPGFSPGAQIPTPAAAIKAVVPSSVVNFGSAPFSRSRRISGTSTDYRRGGSRRPRVHNSSPNGYFHVQVKSVNSPRFGLDFRLLVYMKYILDMFGMLLNSGKMLERDVA